MKAIVVQKDLYSQEVLEAVLYRLAGKLSGQLRSNGDDWEVTISPLRDSLDEIDCRNLFLVELNDQSLRSQISVKTEPLKTLILANAFSRTSLVTQDD